MKNTLTEIPIGFELKKYKINDLFLKKGLQKRKVCIIISKY
ncbi:hypothetical protein F3D3_3760 [Fusibacter sp. 3D3]|nr:hypothetical protein F3D3_3760 [Fusibacter sp. 3D3]